MALPPEAAEALDDETSPERLTQIAEQFPALRSIVAANPSCPSGTREAILSTDRSASELYEAARGGAAEPADVAEDQDPTAAMARVDDSGPGAEAEADPTAALPRVDDDGHGAEAEPEPTAALPRVDDGADQSGDDDRSDEPDRSDDVDRSETAEAARPAVDSAAVGPVASPDAGLDAADDAWSEPLAPAVEPPARGRRAANDAELTELLFYPDAERQVRAPRSGDPDRTPAQGMAPVDAPAPDPRLPRVTGYLDAVSPPSAPAADLEHAPMHASAHGAPIGAPYASAHHAASPAPAPAPGYGYPAPGSPAPAPAGVALDAVADEREGTGRRGTFWIVGCLMLAALVAAGLVTVAITLGTGRDRGTDAAPATTAASSAPADSPTPTEQPSSASPTPSPTLASPAPADAVQASSIHAPSGNITCELNGDGVGCSVGQRSFEGADDCTADQVFSITAGGDTAGLACGQSFGSPGAAPSGTDLAYGTTAANGSVACRSEKTGMTCWNQVTGHGFTVSRSSYTTF